MKSSWFPIIVIITLLGMLVLLATLQYQWLGQISDAEQIRLESRLKDDTKRFAEDFNKEIQGAYFLFQFNLENLNTLQKRYEKWRNYSNYKDLVKDFYYIKNVENSDLLKLDKETGKLEVSNWTKDLLDIKNSFAAKDDYEKFVQKKYALILPVNKNKHQVDEIISKKERKVTVKNEDGNLISENIIGPNLNLSDNSVRKIVKNFKVPMYDGFLVVLMNEDVVKNKILPDLTQKYFEQNDGGSYKIEIIDKDESLIYQTHEQIIKNSDVQTKFFTINPNMVYFFSQDVDFSEKERKKPKRVFLNKSISSTTIKTNSQKEENTNVLSIDISNKDKTKFQIKNEFNSEEIGYWTLKIQHIDGSLKQFITNTRHKNLAISFGILSLLAISIILIFLSSQKAKSLAQKQMDFVSSVSHEFRTPLAVIYSAGENLSDGVIAESGKISHYGSLIKHEGKKLSGMVEQILEFAGANSGKRKYDFRNVEIKRIINDALAECQSVIDDKGFTVELELTDKISKIYADEKALTLALQNLINNALKYSNGSRWLKVSTNYQENDLIITVTDKGIGIADKDKKQIFEPFYRAENVVDEQISGNGLGLSLVKNVVDAHSGKIEISSEVGKGSEFSMHLPVNA